MISVSHGRAPFWNYSIASSLWSTAFVYFSTPQNFELCVQSSNFQIISQLLMAGRVLKLPIAIGCVVLETITFLFKVIFVPWRSSYDPIKSLLNAGNGFKDVQTSNWRDRKLAELTFVGITVSSMRHLFFT